MPSASDPYLVESAARVLDILRLFRLSGRPMALTDVAARLSMPKSTAFRLLYTLEAKGYIERIPETRSYRARPAYRIGFASASSRISFAKEVERGMRAEADRWGIELSVAYNELEARSTIDNVEKFLKAGVDCIIECCPDPEACGEVAARCGAARVPVLGLSFPVPGSTTIRINDYQAGVAGGEALGRALRKEWAGGLDRVLLTSFDSAAASHSARLTGMLDGLRRFTPVPDDIVCHISMAPLAKTNQGLDDLLAHHFRDRRIVVLACTDGCGLGALDAVERANRSPHVRILSQGGTPASRQQMLRPGTPLWGVVSHFPERLGRSAIPVAVRILQGEEAPATVFAKHALLTRDNLRHFYAIPS